MEKRRRCFLRKKKVRGLRTNIGVKRRKVERSKYPKQDNT